MRFIPVLIVFVSLNAFADFDYQAKHAVGLWKPVTGALHKYLQITLQSGSNTLLVEDCGDYELFGKCQGYEKFVTVGRYKWDTDTIAAFYQNWPFPETQIKVDLKNKDALTRLYKDGEVSYIRAQ
jgi:hypothetical protein